MQPPHATLAERFAEFQQLAFPTLSAEGGEEGGDEIVDLHDELALYDGHVAGLITRVLRGQSVPLAELRADDELKARLLRLARNASRPVTAVEAQKLLDYLAWLEELIRLARNVN